MLQQAAGQTPAFQQQFQQFMFYAGPILQILYWIILSVAALWATLLFKKLVGLKAVELGVEEASSAQSDEKVSVDQFVE